MNEYCYLSTNHRVHRYITGHAHSLLVAPAFSSEESTTVTTIISTPRACVFTVLDVVAVWRPAGANLDVSLDLTKHHDDEEEESYSV